MAEAGVGLLEKEAIDVDSYVNKCKEQITIFREAGIIGENDSANKIAKDEEEKRYPSPEDAKIREFIARNKDLIAEKSQHGFDRVLMVPPMDVSDLTAKAGREILRYGKVSGKSVDKARPVDNDVSAASFKENTDDLKGWNIVLVKDTNTNTEGKSAEEVRKMLGTSDHANEDGLNVEEALTLFITDLNTDKQIRPDIANKKSIWLLGEASDRGKTPVMKWSAEKSSPAYEPNLEIDYEGEYHVEGRTAPLVVRLK